MLKKEHVEETIPVLAEAFYDEPMTLMNGTPHEFWNLFQEFCLKTLGPQIVDNGLSVVAIDKETGKVAGAFTGLDDSDDVVQFS